MELARQPHTPRRTPIRILLLSLLFFAALETQAAEADKILYSGCMKMRLSTHVQAAEGRADSISISNDELRDLVQSRLRDASLFDYTEHRQVLSVDVSLVGASFQVRGILHRYLKDTGFGEAGYVMVWTKGSHGTHSGKRDFVLETASRLVDRFMVQYLSANRKACR